MQIYYLSDRKVIKLQGKEVCKILHNVSTNDFNSLPEKSAKYACLLTSKSKFIADFFAYRADERTIYIDIHEKFCKQFIKTINSSKMALKCDAVVTDEIVVFTTHDNSDTELPTILEMGNSIYFLDPRRESLGYRIIGTGNANLVPRCIEYQDLMISLNIVCGEFLDDKAFILEYNFEEQNAVHFAKGCYIGQEMIARAKTVCEIRKKVYKMRLLCSDDVPQAVETSMHCDKISLQHNIFAPNRSRVGKIISINSTGDVLLALLKTSTVANITYMECKENGSVWHLVPA